jgi:phospholipid/cholesterol/gamma-HCH transport system ATP-binding protein
MADDSKPILEFKDVSLRFGDKWVLKKISFTLRPGETRIIYGQAGSGKTTLLKAVIGLVDIDEGEICLFGKNIAELSEQDLYSVRARAGFLFQEGGLFDSLTIGENVEYPLVNQGTSGDSKKGAKDKGPSAGDGESEDIEKRVRDVLRFVELEHTYGQFPSEVSGGMRRRVGIARALVTEPPLVLYDSPTAGLDPITANTIMALVVKERDIRNSASLIVTHRDQDGELMSKFRYTREREELEEVDDEGLDGPGCRTRFIVMKEGEIAFFGTRRQLQASQDEYVKKFIRKENENAG